MRKHIKKSLELTTSKDGVRLNLNGVYYCPENHLAISTDGVSMTLSKTFYEPKLYGMIINHKEMEVIDREFIKYQKVVPSPEKCSSGRVAIPKMYAQKTRDKLLVFFYKDGDFMSISFDQREGYLFAINSSRLSPVAINERLWVRYGSNLSPVQFGFDEDFNDSVIIMPYKV